MDPWRIFIASSGNGHRYAEAIKSVIEDKLKDRLNARVFLWSLGAFEPGSSFLDSLERLPSKYNCGLAVFTADDPLGGLQMAPRDNVVLEFGLFLGAFGRKRSFLLIEDRNDLKIPSDYEGIMQNRFHTVMKEDSTEDHCNAVFTACVNVAEQLKSQPVYQRGEILERIEKNWRQGKYAGEEFQLFSFYGLRDREAAVNRKAELVYHLWADAGVGSWIRAHIVDSEVSSNAERGPVWQVEFRNQPKGFPCNVAIRPGTRCVPSAAPKRFRQLRFDARIPSNFGELAPGAGADVHIGIRVVDALTTHWEYCEVAHEYHLMPVFGEGWQKFEIRLDDSTLWSVFEADGNWRYPDHEPDFSQVLAVVVEMGSEMAGRPGPGGGVIELRGFCLA